MRKQVVKTLIIGAVKMTGLRSVSDTISYVEESLTGDEVEKMTGFLTWVKGDIKRRVFGHVNFWDRFHEWERSVSGSGSRLIRLPFRSMIFREGDCK